MTDSFEAQHVMPVANLKEFFRDALHSSLERQRLNVEDQTEHYVVNLLTLFARSEEEQTRCLGVIDAEVRRFPASADLPVPQMGWNDLEAVGESPLLADVPSGSYAYFVHSYAAPPGPYTRAVTKYGVPFSAVVEQRNFYGTQFHPERSSRAGAQILDNFLKIGL